MLRKISHAIFCAGALFSATCLAETNPIQSNTMVTLVYKFYPNIPKPLTNFSYWSIKAKCTISSPDDYNDILAKAIKKSGSLNEHLLIEGESYPFTVYNNSVINISAEKGAQVELTNLGTHTITATCTT